MSGQKFSALTLTSLPSELLTEIFAGTSRRTLLRVCCVSKHCHAVAIPLLYREVTVGDLDLEALEALVEAFRPRRGLGLHVRSFSVGMSELSLRRALSAITNWDEALPRLEALSIWSLPAEQHAGLLFNAHFKHLDTLHIDIDDNPGWESHKFLRVFAPFVERHGETLKTLHIDGAWTRKSAPPSNVNAKHPSFKLIPPPRQNPDISLPNLLYLCVPYEFLAVAHCVFPRLREISIDWTKLKRFLGTGEAPMIAHAIAACKPLRQIFDTVTVSPSRPFICHNKISEDGGAREKAALIAVATALPDIRVVSMTFSVDRESFVELVSESIEDGLRPFKKLEILLLEASYDFWHSDHEQYLGMWTRACPTLRAVMFNTTDGWIKGNLDVWVNVEVEEFSSRAGMESWFKDIHFGDWNPPPITGIRHRDSDDEDEDFEEKDYSWL